MTKQERLEDYRLAINIARIAAMYGLVSEVMEWARRWKDEYPDAPTSDCVFYGYKEWVK
tara:strand:- start:451 stop:627 length:177 start_codon:yes stop_codon:yes gene_type:complete